MHRPLVLHWNCSSLQDFNTVQPRSSAPSVTVTLSVASPRRWQARQCSITPGAAGEFARFARRRISTRPTGFVRFVAAVAVTVAAPVCRDAATALFALEFFFETSPVYGGIPARPSRHCSPSLRRIATISVRSCPQRRTGSASLSTKLFCQLFSSMRRTLLSQEL
ncbi:hypothetical protein MTO96_012286 [Rhipicephalus appendiculatus]